MNSYKDIYDVLKNKVSEGAVFSLSQPEDALHGDFATNISFILAKEKGGSPKSVAEELVPVLQEELIDIVEKIEVAGPGFINFFLKDEVRTDEVEELAEGAVVILESKGLQRPGDSGRSPDHPKGGLGKVMVEYTDPNCFKVFHIGHLMANAIGEATARLYEASGYDVMRVCYPSDIGRNVAMGVWGVMQKENEKPKQDAELKDKISFLGMCYAFAHGQYGSDEKVKASIIEVNKAIYEGTDAKVMEVYAEGRALSLEYFDQLYEKLGTTFDKTIFESEVADKGAEIVKANMGKIFEESDGAIVYKGEQDGLHTRVFITSEGLPTYEAKELGNYEKKLESSPDASFYVVITANEQNEYFKVVNKVTQKIHPELTDKLVHIGHGMMRLPTGKMASRTGNVIGAEDLLDMITEKLKEKLADKVVAFSDSVQLLNDIAVGAIKFSILKQAPGGDIIFDFDKSISFEGDSGPYLQYTHARLCTLLEKGNVAGISTESYIVENPERELEQILIGYRQTLEKSFKDLGPHHIVQYLLSLTRAFNAMYGRTQIVDVNNKESSAYYVMLAMATKNILSHGLYTLGIKAPERM